jgi:hypothetical protein
MQQDSTMTRPVGAVDLFAQHGARFTWIGRLGILVSFSHMVGTIALYSDRSPWALIVAAANTLLIDLIIWALAEYLYFARVQQYQPTPWAGRLFGMTLIAAVVLNGGDLWAKRPPADVIPGWVSVLMVSTFAVLIPGFIALSAIVRGELETARFGAGRQAEDVEKLRRDAQRAAQLQSMLDRERQAAAQAHAQLAQMQAEARAAIAQAEAQIAQGAASAAQQAQRAEQAQMQVEHLRSQFAQVEQAHAAQLAQMQAEVRAARAALDEIPPTGDLNVRSIAKALQTEGLSNRAIARALNKPESTIRHWLKE